VLLNDLTRIEAGFDQSGFCACRIDQEKPTQAMALVILHSERIARVPEADVTACSWRRVLLSIAG